MENTKTLFNRIPRKAYYGAGIIVVIFILMQSAQFIIPAFAADNPPVTQTINWDSPETQRLWRAACADCHSNETIYPWYSHIAPVSLLVTHDVHEGRDHLNISTDTRIPLNEMIEVIEEGEMPLPIYTSMHPNARLSTSDKEALIAGLKATFGNSQG